MSPKERSEMIRVLRHIQENPGTNTLSIAHRLFETDELLGNCDYYNKVSPILHDLRRLKLVEMENRDGIFRYYITAEGRKLAAEPLRKKVRRGGK
jgi:hypothetical protein